jgi:predicted nuclease of restriction endonuclease-like RecB superfamily
MSSSGTPHAYFLGGTLVLEGVVRSTTPPAPFQWLNARWRCPAVHYRAVRPRLAEHDIRNAILRWSDVSFVDVFKFIKLFKLMHSVAPLAPRTGEGHAEGYRITLYGPISPFVKSTQRYGIQFAKFLPALAREDEVIVVGDTVMIPDFSFTHRKDGRRALLEIVGYWHPDYLRRKLEKVRQAGRRDLILLVYESANVAEGTFEAASASEVLTFKSKPVLKDVLAAVERCAVPRRDTSAA